MEVLGLTEGQHYGLRAKGEFKPAQQQIFNEHKLLIDPYAKLLSDKISWHQDQAAMTNEGQFHSVDSAYCVPKSGVRTEKPDLTGAARVKVGPASRAR